MRKKIFYVLVFVFALRLLAYSNNNTATEHKACGDDAPAISSDQKKPATKVVAEVPEGSSDISPIANFFLFEI
ncbi:MAG TPA: hypothetical protein VFV08_11410 [Puia sp.]|nr:hypothetical protein [Puia sp.]